MQSERLLRSSLGEGPGFFSAMRAQRQHKVHPRASGNRGIDRRIDRPAYDGSDRCGLGQRQLAHRFAEIIFRSRLKSVISSTEIDLVAVHRENLILRVMPLDLQRE